MGADSAAFAIFIINFNSVIRMAFNAAFGTVNPAEEAFGAFRIVNCGLERSPKACFAYASKGWIGERRHWQVSESFRCFTHGCHLLKSIVRVTVKEKDFAKSL